ncbi:MAG: hypothetical protein WBF08_00410 [Candidatus Bathyarchaeia archaeon]
MRSIIVDWFPSEGHYCHKCSKEIKCPKCNNSKVISQGHEVYLCRECGYRLQHITSYSGACRAI